MLFSKASIQAERDANAALRESMVIKRERLRALREKRAAERATQAGAVTLESAVARDRSALRAFSVTCRCTARKPSAHKWTELKASLHFRRGPAPHLAPSAPEQDGIRPRYRRAG
jgi:hypothetical protein